MDFARARHLMVESQVRVNDVTDLRILGAMRTTPRERFAPAHKRVLAYSDIELEVAPGRTLMRTRDLAKLIQALAPKAGERGLEIGGATGYGAAILSACLAKTISLDCEPSLTIAAQAALDACGLGAIRAVTGPLEAGWALDAPYDVIMLNGAAEFTPKAWIDQLAEGGRLGVIIREGAAGRARIYTRAGEGAAYRIAFDAAALLAPELVKPRGFSF